MYSYNTTSQTLQGEYIQRVACKVAYRVATRGLGYPTVWLQ